MDNNIKNKAASLEILKEVKEHLENIHAGNSLTPSQVVQMYNEIKQESEG